MLEISKEFRFEAAHTLPSAPVGSANARVHGHSFRAVVTVRGRPDPDTGLIVHFNRLAEALASARDALDHRMLNDVPGLTFPTLEHLSRWIWRHLAGDVPGLARVTVYRDSCGESCTYEGDTDG